MILLDKHNEFTLYLYHCIYNVSIMIHLELPEQTFNPLFTDIALSGLISDGKSLADAIPLFDPDIINKAYESQKNKPGFDLLSFMDKHFSIPTVSDSGFVTNEGEPLIHHIHRLWAYLRREATNHKAIPGTLISLPHEYIVPGGRFNEVYYWDSYFTMLGLKISGYIDMMDSMMKNFSYLISQTGFIPNGNRTYFLSRSQPPFFSMMVELLAKDKGQGVFLEYLPYMEMEYKFWMDATDHGPDFSGHRIELEKDEVLNRYYDRLTTPRSEMFAADIHLAKVSDLPPAVLFAHIRAACESGWDFSSRWFAGGLNLGTIHTIEILPLDLNCLLYHLETSLALAYKMDSQQKRSEAEKMDQNALTRKNLILKYFWNDKEGYFFDYDFVKKEQTVSVHAAGIFPLCFGLCSDDQALRSLQYLKKHLLADGGVRTTNVISGQQWDAPNGWAPLQWMAFTAALAYGHNDLAFDIAAKWTNLNERVFKNTGKMMEKYNVEDTDAESGGGEYPVQDGFGWTNGVYLAMKDWLVKNQLTW